MVATRLLVSCLKKYMGDRSLNIYTVKTLLSCTNLNDKIFKVEIRVIPDTHSPDLAARAASSPPVCAHSGSTDIGDAIQGDSSVLATLQQSSVSS